MRRNFRRRFYKVTRVLGLGIFIVLLLGSLGWVYRSSFLTGSLKVDLAKQGSIEHYQTVSAVFANEEVLVKSPAAGIPKFLVGEGERIRKGEVIAVIEPVGATPGQGVTSAANQVYAPRGGLVFSSVDGLETILTPENLIDMDLSKVLQQMIEPPQTAQNMEVGVANGRVIGKVVNNLQPTVAVVKMDPEGYKVGKNIKLIINEQSYSAKILRLLEDPKGLVVQFNQYIDGTSQQRLLDISLVVKPSVSGIIIPKSSLWIKGEEHGVYVVKEGAIQYRKVKILDENDQVICVDNLPHGIPIITNPRAGLDGLTMNVKSAS